MKKLIVIPLLLAGCSYDSKFQQIANAINQDRQNIQILAAATNQVNETALKASPGFKKGTKIEPLIKQEAPNATPKP